MSYRKQMTYMNFMRIPDECVKMQEIVDNQRTANMRQLGQRNEAELGYGPSNLISSPSLALSLTSLA
jgi:hypothetical protein